MSADEEYRHFADWWSLQYPARRVPAQASSHFAAWQAGCQYSPINPDNTYTPYGRRSVANLAGLLGLAGQNPTVVSVVNRAYDEVKFLRILNADASS